MIFHVRDQLSGSAGLLVGCGTSLGACGLDVAFLLASSLLHLHGTILSAAGVREVHITDILHHLRTRDDLDIELRRGLLVHSFSFKIHDD